MIAMPRLLLIDYKKCQPEQCNNGVCAAVKACSLNILAQEEPYDKPVMFSPVCKGCMDCIKACPNNALELA